MPSTPKTSKRSEDSPLSSKKRTYASQNAQVERALRLQEETNQLLKQIIVQNNKILEEVQKFNTLHGKND